MSSTDKPTGTTMLKGPDSQVPGGTKEIMFEKFGLRPAVCIGGGGAHT